MMKVAVLFSGGKDSTFALFWTMTQGFEPILITIKAEEHSMMFHHPNINKTKMQAKALGIKQYFLKTNDKKWHDDLKLLLKRLKIEAIAAGAIASEYQKRKIERLGQELGIPTYCPLWHKESELMQEMLDYFEIYITAVAADGLGKELLGKPFKELVKKKVKGIHPMLEGGEGETFVAFAPFFRKKIKIRKFEIRWEKISGTATIKN